MRIHWLLMVIGLSVSQVAAANDGLEQMMVRSWDGAYIPAAVRKPVGEGPFPAILYIHGGVGGGGGKAAAAMRPCGRARRATSWRSNWVGDSATIERHSGRFRQKRTPAPSLVRFSIWWAGKTVSASPARSGSRR